MCRMLASRSSGPVTANGLLPLSSLLADNAVIDSGLSVRKLSENDTFLEPH
jgi:hypothetical protein